MSEKENSQSSNRIPDPTTVTAAVTRPPQPWDVALECQAIASPTIRHGEGDGATAVSRPHAESISIASVWQMDSPEAADIALAGDSGEFIYRRDGHPNERSLADKLALLHGASRAVLTAQGMSAIGAVALATLSPGSNVWLGSELYGKSSKLFLGELARWGVAAHAFDVTATSEIAELANSQVDLVLIETLSNPRLRVPNIRAIAEATHAAGGKLLVDNTFATHLLCQPLSHGADLVIESLSKQVNGHSDSMLGLIAGVSVEAMKRLQDVVSTYGMASSPLDCYLTQRGLMSLAVRMERACANALSLASALEHSALVTSVDYPGLAGHPQHQLATTQLRGGYGWMLSFNIEAEEGRVKRVFDRLKPEIPFVPSLGDISTTVSHPLTTSHRSMPAEVREQLGIRLGTIRVSCGVEPTAWLVERFLQALD